MTNITYDLRGLHLLGPLCMPGPNKIAFTMYKDLEAASQKCDLNMTSHPIRCSDIR